MLIPKLAAGFWRKVFHLLIYYFKLYIGSQQETARCIKRTSSKILSQRSFNRLTRQTQTNFSRVDYKNPYSNHVINRTSMKINPYSTPHQHNSSERESNTESAANSEKEQKPFYSKTTSPQSHVPSSHSASAPRPAFHILSRPHFKILEMELE